MDRADPTDVGAFSALRTFGFVRPSRHLSGAFRTLLAYLLGVLRAGTGRSKAQGLTKWRRDDVSRTTHPLRRHVGERGRRSGQRRAPSGTPTSSSPAHNPNWRPVVPPSRSSDPQGPLRTGRHIEE